MKVLILAGTREQARFYARKFKLAENKYTYVTADMTHGHMGPVVLRVGTWRAREDIAQIEQALHPCQPTYVDIG